MDSLGSTYTKRCAVYETNTGTFSHLSIKNFAEVIRNTENFSNFVFGYYSDYCLSTFDFKHIKVTIIFANHQIFRHLYFVELTLNRTYNKRSK